MTTRRSATWGCSGRSPAGCTPGSSTASERRGPGVVAIDIQFTEPTTLRDDNALIEAVGRIGGVVLSTTEVGKNGSTNVLGGESVLSEFDARAANTVFCPTPAGPIARWSTKWRA